MDSKLNKETLKKTRKAHKLNQTEFGEKLGVSMRTIQNWESGQRNIPNWVQNAIRNLGVNEKNEKKPNELNYVKDGVTISIDEMLSFITVNIETIKELGKLNQLITAINTVENIEKYNQLYEEINKIKQLLEKNKKVL